MSQLSNYTTPESSLEEVIRYTKLLPLRQTIGQLCSQMEERRFLLDRNLKNIEYRNIELDNLTMRLHQMMGQDYFAFLTHKTRMVFERAISDLKQEENRERVQYWKDVLQLKEQLQEKQQEYEKAFLVDVLERPFVGMANRYKHLGISTRNGNLVKHAVEAKSLVTISTSTQERQEEQYHSLQPRQLNFFLPSVTKSSSTAPAARWNTNIGYTEWLSTTAAVGSQLK